MRSHLISASRIFAFVVVLIFALDLRAAEPGPAPDSAILFIGDGMGIAQVTAARIYQGNARDGKLTIDTFDHIALVRTYSADKMVTDSSAAATALSTGTKINNDVVNIDPQGNQLETILQKAKKEGKSVGVVTTTTVTHATPACFYAHVKDRDWERTIAEQLIAYNKVDVVLGGGRQFFAKGRMVNERVREVSEAERSGFQPGADLMDAAAKNGYRLLLKKGELDQASSEVAAGKGPEKVLGLFADGMMSYDILRKTDAEGQPSLAEMANLAIGILSKNPKGFFLMVEGGRIDHACHDNRALEAVTDLIAFDTAVKVGADFQKQHPKALIVVTADHETGGMAISGYANLDISGMRLMTEPPTQGANDIITFATGPGASRKEEINPLPRTDPEYRQPAIRFMASAAHTGVDVGLWATGAGADAFHGSMENTYVAKAMMAALGLK